VGGGGNEAMRLLEYGLLCDVVLVAGLFDCSRGVHVFNRNDEDDEESEEDDYGIDDQEEFLMPSQIPPG